MGKNILQSFLSWLPVGAAITVLSLFGYGLVQQDLRQSANDPQIQMAEDAAAALAAGQTPRSADTAASVDITKSLAPFLIVYDESGAVTSSTARLNGNTPALPQGVLDDARQHGLDGFTWQPAPGVRSATVVTHYAGASSGFVLSGRSLREVEDRESRIEQLAVLGWLVALAGSLATALLVGVAAPFVRERRLQGIGPH
jgi:hypothetical protein